MVMDEEGYTICYRAEGRYRAALFETVEKAHEFVRYMKTMTGLQIRRIWFGEFMA
jgi:hypothetical protein